MKAEDLISMAAPHGIDLTRAAKMASNEKPTPDVVPGKRGARVLVPPPKNRVAGRETRTMLRPEWTIAEIGMATQDLDEYQLAAALYAFAGAKDQTWLLHRGLLERARMFKMLYTWPDTIKDFHGLRREYIPWLCKLVLDEDSNPSLFKVAEGALYAIYMQVHANVWTRELAPRYAELTWAWNDWIGLAARRIQARLCEQEDYREEP